MAERPSYWWTSLVALALILGGCGAAAPERPVGPNQEPLMTTAVSGAEVSRRTVEVAHLEIVQSRARKARTKAIKRIKARRVIAARRAEAARIAKLNPLAGRPWGVYRGPQDQVFRPYESSRGAQRDTLAYIALAPRATWFGAWNDGIQSRVRDYVANSQAGNPKALVQVAVFRMVPWEHAACSRGPSGGEAASYRAWIDEFAAGLGDAHVALILQPDGPFALCSPNKALSSSLVAYAARSFAALPHTSVYIDAGAADWPAPGQGGAPKAVEFLIPAGIRYARGIALNSTHYSDTRLEVARAAEISQLLARQGITGKKAVINTANSGNPFEFGLYRGGDPDNAIVCSSPTDSRNCVTLGIPPTADVANPKWGLGSTTEELARKYVDGYMWFGRPWLVRQNDPFDMGRALQLVRSTPFR